MPAIQYYIFFFFYYFLSRLQEHQPAASSGQSRPHTSGSNIDPPHYAPSSPSHQGGPYTGSGQVDSYIENHMEESQQLADCLKQELKILTEVSTRQM
jgi:hypothetical protein